MILVTICDIDVVDKSFLSGQTDQFMFTCLQHLTVVYNIYRHQHRNWTLTLSFWHFNIGLFRLKGWSVFFFDIHKLISIHEASFYKINQRNLPTVVKGNLINIISIDITRSMLRKLNSVLRSLLTLNFQESFDNHFQDRSPWCQKTVQLNP